MVTTLILTKRVHVTHVSAIQRQMEERGGIRKFTPPYYQYMARLKYPNDEWIIKEAYYKDLADDKLIEGTTYEQFRSWFNHQNAKRRRTYINALKWNDVYKTQTTNTALEWAVKRRSWQEEEHMKQQAIAADNARRRWLKYKWKKSNMGGASFYIGKEHHIVFDKGLIKPIYHYFPFRGTGRGTKRRRVDFTTTKGMKYFVYIDADKTKQYVMGRVKSFNAKSPDNKINNIVYH